MSQEALKPISLIFRCPECGKNVEVYIKPQEFVDSLSGIVRIPIEHKKPSPHMLILDIDQNGFVRGAYLYRYKPKVHMIPIKEIMDYLGIENLAYFLYYLLKGTKIFLHGDNKAIKMAKQFANLVNERDIIVSDKREAKEKINPKKIKKPKAAIRSLLQIISRIANLSSDDARSEWIRREYTKLKKGLTRLKNIINSRDSWTLDELLSEIKMNINKDDLRLLIDILEDVGCRISAKIKDIEYKIKSMFA